MDVRASKSEWMLYFCTEFQCFPFKQKISKKLQSNFLSLNILIHKVEEIYRMIQFDIIYPKNVHHLGHPFYFGNMQFGCLIAIVTL